MQTPWIELAQSKPTADLERFAPHDQTTSHTWQALFAYQVVPRPFEDREKLKWGFNLGVLHEEALDRQKLFVESLHCVDLRAQCETPEKNTLALRVLKVPALDGLIFGLVGKVYGPTSADARREALEFARSVSASLPHDYTAVPAEQRLQFQMLAGREILNACYKPNTLVNLRRLETPMHAAGELFYLLGEWVTAPHADEAIWRALASLEQPALLNISLRPTILDELENRSLGKLLNQAKTIRANNPQDIPYGAYLDWAIAVLSDRAAELTRPYQLQIHFAAPGGVPGYLPRITGAALTRSPKDDAIHRAYEVRVPGSPAEAAAWAPYVYWADFIPLPPLTEIRPHIRDLVSPTEAHAVFRLPYLNAPGVPALNILNAEAAAVLESIHHLNTNTSAQYSSGMEPSH